MSEYQYYEFVAIDRPLTRKEMAELRSRSSRAAIMSRRRGDGITKAISLKAQP